MQGNPKSKQQAKDQAKSKPGGKRKDQGRSTVAGTGEGPGEIAKQGPGLEDKGESKLVVHRDPQTSAHIVCNSSQPSTLREQLFGTVGFAPGLSLR